MIWSYGANGGKLARPDGLRLMGLLASITKTHGGKGKLDLVCSVPRCLSIRLVSLPLRILNLIDQHRGRWTVDADGGRWRRHDNSTRWPADGGASSTRPVGHAGDSGCGSAPALHLTPANATMAPKKSRYVMKGIFNSEIRILNTLSLSSI